MMKTLLNSLFYFVSPDVKLKNKIASGWLFLVTFAILCWLGFVWVKQAYAAFGVLGIISIAVGVVTAWALITWLNEG